MPCPQCQHENRETAKFCEACGARLIHCCFYCAHAVSPQATYCEECGAPLTALAAPRGGAASSEAAAERRFQTLLLAVIGLLRYEGRITYRSLQYALDIDATMLAEICEELRLRRLAIDEEGKVLVWVAAQPEMTATHNLTHRLDASLDETPAERSVHDQLTAPEAERRQLTVMFCDLAESTQLSQQLDPEDLREVVRAYQETAAEVIDHYEGHMAQYLGDGLLIYFGWPVAHEDDAQRAAHAGLGILEAVTARLNPRLRREQGVALAVRLGVHTGPVVVGEMGGGNRHENLAMGETVNIAARLEGLAAAQTMVISQATARLLQDAFALTDLGPHKLKGVAEPMPVFRVLKPLDSDHDGDADPTDDRVFLIGRDEEMGLLLRRWQQSQDGVGQVVLISGEAGIGKSALVTAMRRRVTDEGYARLTFRCSPYHTTSALYPIVTRLERLLRLNSDDPPGAKLDKLEQALRTTGMVLEEAAPILAGLLSLSIADRYPESILTLQQQRQRTLDTLVGWLLAEAERQPLLTVWEDLHWADPSTLELLSLLLDQTPTAPILNVLTFRPDFEPPWSTRSHMTPIALNRLERLQIEALMTHLAEGVSLPAEVVDHIVDKTDGVPLYVEELTKMLLETGLLKKETDRYRLTGPLLSVAIPDTLQDSLMARLDQMGMAKEAAQLGAVIGREFGYKMLRAISSQNDAALQSSLARLVSAELLYQRGRPPRATYVFKHALIQDAAYASLLRSTRQQAHQQIAKQLENHFPETAMEQPELIARHYTEAGCAESAVAYWQRAGQQALQRSANQEAIRRLTTALDLLASLADAPERAQQELDIHLALGPALMMTQGMSVPQVRRLYARARELSHRVEDAARLVSVLYGLWLSEYPRGALQTAHELAAELLSLAQQAQAPTLLVGAHRAMGTTLFYRGELTGGLEHFEQAVAYRATGQHPELIKLYGQDLLALCLVSASWSLWSLGHPDQALRRCQEALDLAQRLSHPSTLAFVLSWSASLHLWRREPETTQDRAEALIALAQEQGFANRLSEATISWGWALAAQGQIPGGIAQIKQGLAVLEDTGAQLGQVFRSALLAEVYGMGGQPDEGLRVVAEALEVVGRTGVCWYEAELYRLKGELLLHQSSVNQADAETCFRQALRIAQGQHAKSWELRAATSLARLWRSQGKGQVAYDLLAPVYGWFTEGFDTADLREAQDLLTGLGG